MIPMSRTVLALLVALVLAAIAAALASSAGVGSWGVTLIGAAVGIAALTLVDREGFYGPRRPRSHH